MPIEYVNMKFQIRNCRKITDTDCAGCVSYFFIFPKTETKQFASYFYCTYLLFGEFLLVYRIV